jgi:CheY-like chemotaxis protein
MGGDLIAYNLKPGAGFSFTIPVQPGREPEPFELPATTRLLLVEDNQQNQDLILRYLRVLNVQVVTAENGQQCLDLLTQSDFDLILMDVQMPVMDGLSATRSIRDPKSKVRNHSIYILGLTAQALEGDRERCLSAGMTDYLSKPVRKHELLEKIRYLLRRRYQS